MEDQTLKRSRFSEEQIITVVKEHELGAETSDLCRKHGISEATFYNWNSKFGGTHLSEAKRLKALEGENAKLMKLLVDAMLDNAGLKDLIFLVHTKLRKRNRRKLRATLFRKKAI